MSKITNIPEVATCKKMLILVVIKNDWNDWMISFVKRYSTVKEIAYFKCHLVLI